MIDINLIEKKANELLLKHELQLEGWYIVIDNKPKRRLGQCRPRLRQIGLSKQVLTRCRWEEIVDTILHEIAHALVGAGHGHDEVWKAKCREIGAKPDRLARVKFTEPTKYLWTGVCPNGHTARRHRKPSGRVQSCGKCMPKKFDERYLITWTKNY